MKNSLKDATANLMALRKKINEYEAQLKAAITPLKAERDNLQTKILEIMAKEGQFSAKYEIAGEKVNIAKVVRKTLKIIDEAALIEYLTKEKLDKEYLETRVNQLFFDSMGKTILKEGKPIIGTQIQESEYISIRQ